MRAAECIPRTAVTVRAADDFYRFIDGWHGVIAERQDCVHVRVECLNKDGQPVEFLVPPDQLEKRHE